MPNWKLSATASFCGIHDSCCVFGELCCLCNPFVVVADLCVYSWFVLVCTADTPAHYPEQKHPTRRFTHQRTTRVTLWGEDAPVSQCLQYEQGVPLVFEGPYGYWLAVNEKNYRFKSIILQTIECCGNRSAITFMIQIIQAFSIFWMILK